MAIVKFTQKRRNGLQLITQQVIDAKFLKTFTKPQSNGKNMKKDTSHSIICTKIMETAKICKNTLNSLKKYIDSYFISHLRTIDQFTFSKEKKISCFALNWHWSGQRYVNVELYFKDCCNCISLRKSLKKWRKNMDIPQFGSITS